MSAGVLLLTACSSSPSPVPPTRSAAADLVAFSHASNLVPVTVTIDGASGVLIVDTGSPFVVLDPSAFPGAPAEGATGAIATLTAGSTTLSGVQAYGSKQISSPDPAVPLSGLLGCDVICQSIASFNYRDAVFTLGPADPPEGLEPSTTVPFSLLGGGAARSGNSTVTLPKSRIVVSVSIEGTAHTMIVDTGASDVTVRSPVFSTLTHDGRATMQAGTVETVSGTSRATLSRVRSIVLDGVEVDGVVVLGDASTDSLFDTVGQEVGRTIDGSLGGTFLNQFYVSIDYARQAMTLARYSDTSFVIDPGQRLGFTLGRTPNGQYQVASVVPGSDAANKGVQAGDGIVAIDGTELSGASDSEILAQVSGPVGTTKDVTFGNAKSLGGQTVGIQVSELLPLP